MLAKRRKKDRGKPVRHAENSLKKNERILGTRNLPSMLPQSKSINQSEKRIKYPENANMYEHFCRNECTNIVIKFIIFKIKKQVVWLHLVLSSFGSTIVAHRLNSIHLLFNITNPIM